MNVEELLIELAGFNDDIKVVCDGREVDNAYYFEETSQEDECICLSLKPVRKKKK